MSTAVCAHRRLFYDPVQHESGTYSASWACSYCNTHFIIMPSDELVSMRSRLVHAIRIQQLAESYIACAENLGETGASDDDIDAIVEAETTAYEALVKAIRPPAPERTITDDDPDNDNDYPTTGEP